MLKVIRKGNDVELLINDSIEDLIKLELEIKVFDKNGKVIKKKRFKCKSFLLNFARFLHAVLAGTTDTVVDTSGISRSVTGVKDEGTINFDHYLSEFDVQFFIATGAEGDDSLGLVVGSGTTAVSPSDYALESQIPHGSADGQLYHYATTFVEPYSDAEGLHFEIYRQFANHGSITVSISEAGIITYFRFYMKDGKLGTLINQTAYFLIIRDVFSAIDIPPAGGAEIRYIFTFSETTNWMAEAIYSFLSNTSRTFTDTSGSSVSANFAVSQSLYATSDQHRSYVVHLSDAKGGDADSSKGIVVGSGVTPFDPTQYSLESLIPHGMETGQLDYQAQQDLGLEELSDRYRIGFSRIFTNLSGGNITISEIGIYAYHRVLLGTAQHPVINKTVRYLVFRKTLPTSAIISHLASFKITWYLAIPK